MATFSRRHKFSDWPNEDVPAIAAGVYAVWDGDTLIYCGMSGRQFARAVSSGRLSGDQFCVYVVNSCSSVATDRLSMDEARGTLTRPREYAGRMPSSGGNEVGPPLGAMSPYESWTRSPTSTPNCVHGAHDPGARLVDFDDEGSSRRCRRKEERWTFCIPVARGWTCTKTALSPACGA